jgi:hypothetical protein
MPAEALLPLVSKPVAPKKKARRPVNIVKNALTNSKRSSTAAIDRHRKANLPELDRGIREIASKGAGGATQRK